jgi:class 3 adenylate cyclase
MAVVMFVDVVSSTERVATMGDRPWLALLERLLSDVRRDVDRLGGVVVAHTGDGLVATFDRATSAAQCAGAATVLARTHGLEVRCGVHAGEFERTELGIGGLTVHVAARICALATPGSVLLSRTTAEMLTRSGLELHPYGVVALRGVPGQWTLFTCAGRRAGDLILIADDEHRCIG